MGNTNIKDLPSNSRKSKEETRKKKIEPIVKGKVKQQKKTMGQRFFSVFTEDGEGLSGVFEYVMYDVLVPAAKNTISDVVSGGIERLLYGSNKRPGNVRRGGTKSYVSYSSPSRSRGSRNTLVPERGRSYNRRNKDDFEDLVFENRNEAEEVLSRMIILIEEYGVASVSDLKQLVGLDANFTDEGAGWTNLSRSVVSRTRDGYTITFPRVENI